MKKLLIFLMLFFNGCAEFENKSESKDTCRNFVVVNSNDTIPIIDSETIKYPYINSERNIEFNERLRGHYVSITYYLWFDGDIIETNFLNEQSYPASQLYEQEQKLKIYANKRIKYFMDLKHIK